MPTVGGKRHDGLASKEKKACQELNSNACIAHLLVNLDAMILTFVVVIVLSACFSSFNGRSPASLQLPLRRLHSMALPILKNRKTI